MVTKAALDYANKQLEEAANMIARLQARPPEVCTGSGTVARDFRQYMPGPASECGICGNQVGTQDGCHIVTHPYRPTCHCPDPKVQHLDTCLAFWPGGLKKS
jgi:hypothetical protein